MLALESLARLSSNELTSSRKRELVLNSDLKSEIQFYYFQNGISPENKQGN